MNNQHSIARSFNLMAAGALLLLLLGWLTAGRAAAQSTGPLPLPDMLIYGTVTNATGDALDSGTIKALFDGQTIASAEIGAINGTDYTFVLAVPMGMLKPGGADRGTGMALVGDTLTFQVDDLPAYYQDPITSLTVNQLRIPSGAAGRGFALNLALPDAMRYPIGDVNANGARNAADAMLTLKYDIGLIIGVTSFPPGPNTVYLPLCDIVQNGRCDSSDALRILQCDVGLTTVACPTEMIAAAPNPNVAAQAWTTQPTDGVASQGAQSTVAGAADAAAVRLKLDVSQAAESTDVAVSVLLTGGADRFGAGTLELRYDPQALALVGCDAVSGEHFDMAFCNPDYAAGTVRLGAIAANGAAEGAELATVRFQRIDGAQNDLAPSLELTAESITGVDGVALGWSLEGVAVPEASMQHWLFLPSVVNHAGQAALESTGEPAIEPTPLPVDPTPEPTAVPTEEATPEVTPELTPTEAPTEEPTPETTPELTPTEAPTEEATPEATPELTPTEAPTEEPTPEATPELTPTEAPTAEPTAPPAEEATPTVEPESSALSLPQNRFSLYLPAVSGGAITTTVGAGDAPEVDAPPVDDAAPAPEAEASLHAAALVAALPSTGQQRRSRVGFAVRRHLRRPLV